MVRWRVLLARINPSTSPWGTTVYLRTKGIIKASLTPIIYSLPFRRGWIVCLTVWWIQGNIVFLRPGRARELWTAAMDLALWTRFGELLVVTVTSCTGSKSMKSKTSDVLPLVSSRRQILQNNRLRVAHSAKRRKQSSSLFIIQMRAWVSLVASPTTTRTPAEQLFIEELNFHNFSSWELSWFIKPKRSISLHWDLDSTIGGIHPMGCAKRVSKVSEKFLHPKFSWDTFKVYPEGHSG